MTSNTTHTDQHATDDTPAFRYSAKLANEIEARWQDRWDLDGTYRAPNPGEAGFDGANPPPKKFILDMFPYPSGAGIHVGHPLGYIATDIYARYLRMTGHNVLHAMGFDAFGLPAEQYAIATNTHPRITTEANIANMRRQLRRLGLGHDPRRGVSTTDEAYYRWTQWIFLRIYNSWYDPEAPARQAPARQATEAGAKGTTSTRGRARPISELVAEFESGTRRIPGHDKAWKLLGERAQAEVLDGFRLAFLAEVPVNWCPMLGTVLANEEVTSEGRSERGNHPVYKRPLKQWMMRITSYADRLASDLDLVRWPEAIKAMQRNWIGRSEGAHVDFACSTRRIRVFTTRPDTLYGATYLVLAPDHEMVDALTTEKYGETKFLKGVFPGSEELLARRATPKEVVAASRAYAATKSDDDRAQGKEKTGAFIGAYAINPINGARVPVFIADYVLTGYGTGAIMAVPAHDERDFEFAGVFGLPVVEVVRATGADAASTGSTVKGTCFSGEGVAINSAVIDGLPTGEAKRKIAAHIEAQGMGRAVVQYKLRDWLFSRQRYWGEPFPIVFDESGLAHGLPESMLPVKLPHMENFQPDSSDDANAPVVTPLGRAREWAQVELDLGDGRGVRRLMRETNTMPNWAGSCWYYLRYLDPENEHALVGAEAERYWMNSTTESGAAHAGGVDLYVGGVEHAVLHLLYARFWHKVLFDLGHVSTPEPFGRLFNQGYVQAYAYTDARGVYVPAEEVVEGPEVSVRVGELTLRSGEVEPLLKATRYSWKGEPVFQSYGKMGKSLKNAVAPDEVCAEFGCDTLRVYEMSMGPLEASKPWNTRDIAGAYRFLQRVWRCVVDERTGEARVDDAPVDAQRDAALLRSLHKTIAGVRREMETLGFNTAVAKLIEFTNELTKWLGESRRTPRAVAEALTLMLAPLAPHMGEELWSKLGHSTSVVRAPFPVADEALARDSEIEVPVSLNGKLKGTIVVAAGLDKAGLEAAAMASETVRALIEGKTIKKVVVVPGKMVNLVV
jgi:leucyl-tRNA synthetase